MTDQISPTLERLEDQIGWYDKKSQTAQRRYKVLKIAQIGAAAVLPLIAVFDIPEPEKAAAVLGLVVLVLEGAQQLNQYHQNWAAYRSTCEALKHEKYLRLAGAGPYAGAENPDGPARGPHRGADLARARQVGVEPGARRQAGPAPRVRRNQRAAGLAPA
jgi:hypothetical protein